MREIAILCIGFFTGCAVTSLIIADALKDAGVIK